MFQNWLKDKRVDVEVPLISDINGINTQWRKSTGDKPSS